MPELTGCSYSYAIAGGMLSSGNAIPASQLDFLLRHSVKLLNIYYHLVANQRPPLQPTSSKAASGKSGKNELFTLVNSGGGGAKEQATLQALGYFASDYVYMKLYNILRGANDSYKVSQSRRRWQQERSEQRCKPPLSRGWRAEMAKVLAGTCAEIYPILQ